MELYMEKKHVPTEMSSMQQLVVNLGNSKPSLTSIDSLKWCHDTFVGFFSEILYWKGQ